MNCIIWEYYTIYFIATASAITSLVQTASTTIQPIILSKVPPPSSLLPSSSSKEDPSSSTREDPSSSSRESSLVAAFTSLSITTNQATPISSFVPVSTESSSVGMFKIVV